MCFVAHVAATITYVLPIRLSRAAGPEFFGYLRWLAARTELVVVDGSDLAVFAEHSRCMPPGATHCAPDTDLAACANGKVAGVVTGFRRASHDAIVVADDDVRYDEEGLTRVASALDGADLVRPQNYFSPLTWHACYDTARSLLNRMSGGDWPGTLAVRRSALPQRGYDGDVLFENLELVRTVVAAGGTAICPLDLFVRRLPSSTRHFWSQRIRQAYDEMARPLRLVVWLAILPTLVIAASRGRRDLLLAMAAGSMAIAEIGRWRGNGRRVFPAMASLLVPIWLLERGVCAWLALTAYVVWGGVPYHGRLVRRAATPLRHLRGTPLV